MKCISQLIVMLVLIINLLMGGLGIAGEKPIIGVWMVLDEPNYLVEFSTEQEDIIEKKGAEILAARLSERSGFLDFQPNTAGKWTLTVKLNRKDPTARGDLHEVGFHLYLSGLSIDPTKKTYWIFHPIDKYNDVVFKVDVFLVEIDWALQKADYDKLIQDLLSQIPVAHKAELYRNFMGVGWKLSDHSHEDLCMKDESELIIESELKANGEGFIYKVYTIVEKGSGDNWRNLNIKCRVLEAKNEQRLRNALEQLAREKIKVEAVYVRKYILLHQCKRQVSPLNSGFWR